MIDDREHDVRHVGLAVLRKDQHGLPGLHAEARARELVVALCIGGVQADGDRVEDSLELRCDVLAAVLQLREAIRVQARGWLRLSGCRRL